MKSFIYLFACLVCFIFSLPQSLWAQSDCHNVDPAAETPITNVSLPPTAICVPRISNGFPVPNPACTPGAVNPGVTLEVLQDPAYKTRCTRDQASSRQEKNATYDWYNFPHPSGNTGANQVCELDHFIPLELGGADTLDNIWPQCGPNAVALRERYFKQKDLVENYLAAQAKAGAIDLSEAQAGIARDWTQYLEAARQSVAVASLQMKQPASREALFVLNKHSRAFRIAANQRTAHHRLRYRTVHLATTRYFRRHAQQYFYYRCTSKQPNRFEDHCARIFIRLR